MIDRTTVSSGPDDTGDATAEVLNDLYSAPVPWRATLTSTLIALAILAATR